MELHHLTSLLLHLLQKRADVILLVKRIVEGVIEVEVQVYSDHLLFSSLLDNLDIPVKTYSAFAPP
jgi:hypothetical protein